MEDLPYTSEVDVIRTFFFFLAAIFKTASVPLMLFMHGRNRAFDDIEDPHRCGQVKNNVGAVHQFRQQLLARTLSGINSSRGLDRTASGFQCYRKKDRRALLRGDRV